MGAESSLWKTLKSNGQKYYGKDLDMQRHECSITPGFPDVSAVKSFLCDSVETAWIELKAVREYPARVQTIVRIKHFTQDQRDWLRHRGEMGAYCKVLLQVERDYYLFDWSVVDDVGFVDRAGLEQRAMIYCKGRADWPHIIDGFFL